MSEDPKLRYRRIEQAIEGAGGPGSPRRFAERLLPRLFSELGESEGLVCVQLLERREGQVRMLRHEGDGAADLGTWTPDGWPAAIELPWAGETPSGPAALFPIGAELVVALRFAAGPARSTAERLSLVTPIHYAVSQQLRHRELEDDFEQARAIQTSLLPAGVPVFGDLDVAAFSRPARKVGGDLYDFIPLEGDALGIAVADASGHGLPAALQARDVVTGLRMGVEREFRLTRTIEKLNRVIHRSGLTTRFISLVYAELERNGNLFYVNAGHPPPLLIDDAGFHELTVGGVLLGPYPEAVYKMGFAHLDRGATLLLYTDGVIERRAPNGDMYGLERLATWLGAHRDDPAAAALEDLVRELETFGGGVPADDDVTAMFVRRPQ